MAKDFTNVKVYNGKTPVRRDTVPALTQMLATNMKALKSVLPAHISPERMARVALNTVRHNPKLCQCAPETLLAAIMEASTLGLEIDSRGQAYLVPFWNGKTQTNDVQLIVGYKGMIALAYRSGKIQSIQANVIGENDKFDYALGLHPRLEHIPNMRERGPIIGAYAIAIFKDGATQFDVMSIEEINKIRNASKSKDSGPWAMWFEAMSKKSVVKRLCKYLPLSPEIQRAVALDDAADAGVTQQFDSVIENAMIDVPQAEAEPLPEPEPTPEAQPELLPDNAEVKEGESA